MLGKYISLQEFEMPKEKKHLSEVTKKLISIALMGDKNPNYGRVGEKHPMFGKHHTPEARMKISVSLLGNKRTLGRKHTLEELEKMSKAHLCGKPKITKKEYQKNYQLEHSEELKQKSRVWRKKHHEEIKEKKRIDEQNLRLKAILILSNGTNTCASCGEDRIDGLTVDHIHGGGTKHVKLVGNIYRWLKKHNYPKDDFQVLCMNCQMEKVLIYGENQRIKNPTPKRQKQKTQEEKRSDTLKWEVLSAYSDSPIPFCKVCHTTNIWHLCLDHVDGDGAEDRKKYSCRGGYAFYSKLRALGYPDKDKYQVLCHTCNKIKQRINGENREKFHNNKVDSL